MIMYYDSDGDINVTERKPQYIIKEKGKDT